jgi:hypothetical protein
MTRKSKKRNRRSRRKNRANRGQSNLLSNSGFLSKPVTCYVPRGLQFVPDELDCWARTDVNTVTTGTLDATTWKVNSVFNNFGPQLNYAGAFGANVPSGAIAMMSVPSPAGTAGFYNRSTVLEVDCEIELTSLPGGVSAPAYIMMIPSGSPSLLGMVSSELREQRGVVVATIPASTATMPLTRPFKVRNGFTIWDLLGTNRKHVRESYDYSQVVNADPLYPAYLHVSVASADGATNFNYQIRFSFWIHFLFRRINPLDTAVPTLQSLQQQVADLRQQLGGSVGVQTSWFGSRSK